MLNGQFGITLFWMSTLTIKLPPEQRVWLEKQARQLKRSKSQIIRDLIAERRSNGKETVGEALADLCGCLKGSRDLSTRSLKGYGRS